jgi:hypothetical protein
MLPLRRRSNEPVAIDAFGGTLLAEIAASTTIDAAAGSESLAQRSTRA